MQSSFLVDMLRKLSQLATRRAVILCAICVGDGHCGNASDDTAPQAASLLQAIEANNNSISSFDVKIHVLRLNPKPGSEISSNDRQKRMIWEQKGQRHLIAAWTVIDEFADGQSQSRGRLSAAIFDDSNKGFIFNGKGRRPIMVNAETFALFRYQIGWLDPRPIGFYPMVYIESQPQKDELWSSFTVASQNHSFHETSSSEGEVTIKTYRTEEVQGEVVWVFDLKTLMPKSRSIIETNLISKERLAYDRDVFAWVKRNGVFVPSQISNDNRQSTRDKEGKRIDYMVTSDYQFDWISVNEAIDENLFSANQFSSPESIRKFIGLGE